MVQGITDQEVAFKAWVDETFPTDLMHPAIRAAFVAGWDAHRKSVEMLESLKIPDADF